MDKGGVGGLKNWTLFIDFICVSSVMLLSISKTKTGSCQSFFLQKIVYNKIVRSLDYLNRCKVLYVYVDNTVLV